MSWLGKTLGSWLGGWLGAQSPSQPALVNIRAALESALNAITPPFATAWENVAFLPTDGAPYQQVHLLFAKPDNFSFGRGWRELGFMQVKVVYPSQAGPAAAAARAETIRSTFYKGAIFVSGGLSIIVEKTPTVSPGRIEEGRYAVPIKIRFFVNGMS